MHITQTVVAWPEAAARALDAALDVAERQIALRPG
jgi:hypothetical protein